MPSPPDPPIPRRPAPVRNVAEDEQISRLLTLANIQFRRGQTAEAEKAVHEILQTRPQDASAHELLADIQLARQDFDGAQASLRTALSLEPSRATAEAKFARAVLRRTEQKRIQTMGVAYAASDTALMRISGGTRKTGQWAALGSALVPGLGQYVNGEAAKGIVLAAVYFLIIILMAVLPDTRGLAHQISLLFVPSFKASRSQTSPVSGLAWFLLFLLVSDWLYAVVDAALASRRAAAASSRSPQDGWQV